MSDDLKNILSNNASPEKNNSDEIRKYILHELSDADQHKLEKQLLDDDFEADALEGLKTIKDNQKIDLHLYQLKKSLKAKTTIKKDRFEKRKVKSPWWLYFSILLLLLIIILVYFYLHNMQ